MIQAYSDDLLIVGVTRGNIDKLTAHQPMKIDLRRSVSRVVLVFGETKPDIIAEIEKSGVYFEAAHKAAAEADPS